MNKARKRRPYSAGNKLPESTGDKLLDLPGKVGDFTGGSIAESCLTLRGTEIIWSHSSVESTLVPWQTKQPDCIRQLHIAPVSDVTCN